MKHSGQKQERYGIFVLGQILTLILVLGIIPYVWV